jgi:hypothetical protein
MSTKTKEIAKVCHAILQDINFHTFLFQIDQDLAAEAHARGCSCGGVLHSARYPRKPRGAPRGLGPEQASRLSFCCARDGCRRRTTPPSVRFLGRRVYLSAVVVLVSAMQNGVTGKRAWPLHEVVGISLRTLKRWRQWWREGFVASPFWQHAKGQLPAPIEGATLPTSLLAYFTGEDVATRLIQLLRFLLPLTTSERVI